MSFLNVLVLFSLGFYCYGISVDIIEEGITETEANEIFGVNKKWVLTRSEVLDDSLNKAKSDRQRAGNLKDELEEVTTKKILSQDAELEKVIRKVSSILDEVDVAARKFPKLEAELEEVAGKVSNNLDAMADGMKKIFPKISREMRDLSVAFEDILADVKEWNIKISKTVNHAGHAIGVFFEKDLSGLLKESRGYLKNLDSSITQIVQDIEERALKLIDNYIDVVPSIGEAMDNFVSVLISLRILLALWIVISVAILVWLVLVIYDKIESIKLKFAADEAENKKDSFLKLFRKKSSNTGAMNSQSTTEAGVYYSKPTGREKTRDVEFTKMDEIALEIEKTSSASYEWSKDKGQDVESKKFEKGGDELVKKKDDDTSDDIATTKRDNAKAKKKEK